ncbi:hypothetical protein D9756_007087 [Leucocoprinus leucothites]|uniref:Carbohydrate esterase family 16 protein n=1 Tax=Leucocoprinus leucothites TaxID=201217 RepID=A0A8H5D6P9_9AGAR|nr:hypothetical protein D9756_007087 [Leucoagaricus leucothites]
MLEQGSYQTRISNIDPIAEDSLFIALTALITLLPAIAVAGQAGHGHGNDDHGGNPTYPQPFHKNDLKALVTFGDSYTDTTWITNGGTIQWPQYVARYAGIDLYPYAKSGATCSNNITYRPFPPIPTFLGDERNHTIRLNERETLYSLWIGTNDIGVSSLLTGDNKASIVDVTECMINWVTTMYEHGARNFLFQNMVPLELTPLYSADSWPNRYWHLERNTTEWSVTVRELVLSGNALTKLMLGNLASKLHDINNGSRSGLMIGLFDSHTLFGDMYANPGNYLNGTAPAFNVTGCVDSCIYQVGESNESICTMVNGTDRDSYLWYDELHPSEQADRHVAKEVANIFEGTGSKFVTWLS